MFAVNIVVLPGRYRARTLTSVSFLGPILGKTALEIILANKPVAVRMTYQRDLKYMHTISEKETPYLENDIKKHIGGRVEDDMYDTFDRRLRRRKEVPGIYTKVMGREVNFKRSKREVIYKPKKPALPAWIDATSSFKLELEFIVSAEGEVKEVIPAISSGNPEVDLIGIRYLKNWRFAPLASGLEQKRSIEFTFEAED